MKPKLISYKGIHILEPIKVDQISIGVFKQTWKARWCGSKEIGIFQSIEDAKKAIDEKDKKENMNFVMAPCVMQVGSR